jgi:hypothetical protein
MIHELPFKVVSSNGTDEVLARAVNMLIARGAYREAARIYPGRADRAAPGRADHRGHTAGARVNRSGWPFGSS